MGEEACSIREQPLSRQPRSTKSGISAVDEDESRFLITEESDPQFNTLFFPEGSSFNFFDF